MEEKIEDKLNKMGFGPGSKPGKVKCTWDKSKHNGKPCPIHSGQSVADIDWEEKIDPREYTEGEWPYEFNETNEYYTPGSDKLREQGTPQVDAAYLFPNVQQQMHPNSYVANKIKKLLANKVPWEKWQDKMKRHFKDMYYSSKIFENKIVPYLVETQSHKSPLVSEFLSYGISANTNDNVDITGVDYMCNGQDGKPTDIAIDLKSINPDRFPITTEIMRKMSDGDLNTHFFYVNHFLNNNVTPKDVYDAYMSDGGKGKGVEQLIEQSYNGSDLYVMSQKSLKKGVDLFNPNGLLFKMEDKMSKIFKDGVLVKPDTQEFMDYVNSGETLTDEEMEEGYYREPEEDDYALDMQAEFGLSVKRVGQSDLYRLKIECGKDEEGKSIYAFYDLELTSIDKYGTKGFKGKLKIPFKVMGANGLIKASTFNGLMKK